MITVLQKIFNKAKHIFIRKVQPQLIQTEQKITTNLSAPKRIEFSQVVVGASLIFAFIWINWFFVLVTIGIEASVMASVIESILQNIVYVVLTYFIYQGWLKNSRNKYGIASDGIPYVLKAKYNAAFGTETPDVDSNTYTSNVTEEDTIDPDDIIAGE